jgi:hypothetical protein
MTILWEARREEQKRREAEFEATLAKYRPQIIGTKIVDGHEVKICQTAYADGSVTNRFVKSTSTRKEDYAGL